ncbi:hypothetical protein [Paenibacillus polymyxa]|uniref:hypothetical protein n=1 Tax=Paenibacillus polymyxa TaxID=1406 RepID=UPI002AB57AC5|nr:hypothetical protein [Paenibacillus polymyxa]MDY8021277.1 hypothetical protein [Paenibacillus polymyxa]
MCRQGDEDDMGSALAKKYPHLKLKPDYKKLMENVELPKVKDGTIILNPANEHHKKWFDLENGESNE